MKGTGNANKRLPQDAAPHAAADLLHSLDLDRLEITYYPSGKLLLNVPTESFDAQVRAEILEGIATALHAKMRRAIDGEAMTPMTIGEALSLPVVISISEASRAFRISRSEGYRLAAAGEFPCAVIRIGRRYRVVTADLLRVLGLTAETLRTLGIEPGA